ncbi:hypothetical protein [Morganella morganii IS15]|nr:hypothetical protein [Morganella morganii IS15]CDK65264.1 hypothetical protein [Morganella morganii IS15]
MKECNSSKDWSGLDVIIIFESFISSLNIFIFFMISFFISNGISSTPSKK